MRTMLKRFRITKQVEGFPVEHYVYLGSFDMDAEHESTLAYYEKYPESRGKFCRTLVIAELKEEDDG